MSSELLTIHIPEGINYECSGCGGCCHGWPVPLTEADYIRIASATGTKPEPTAASDPPVNAPDNDLAPTRFLGKRPDGGCEYLREDNHCQLHADFGAEMKPAVCQLFPYNFTESPSGVFVSVNFGSVAAIFNSGRALSEQSDLLAAKYELYRSLVSPDSRDWSGIQLVSGSPLTWEQYLPLDALLVKLITEDEPRRISRTLLLCSRFLVGEIPRGTKVATPVISKVRPKVADQLLLKRLMDIYLTEDVHAYSDFDLYSQALLSDLENTPPTPTISLDGLNCTFGQIYSFTLGELSKDSEDLLFRFVYSKVFAKLYFGPGFANLSVLSGIHHLLALVILIRIKIKGMCIQRHCKSLEITDIAGIIRTLERRLGQVTFSGESEKVLDLFMTDPERMQRLVSLAH